jgi:hypothetical protein
MTQVSVCFMEFVLQNKMNLVAQFHSDHFHRGEILHALLGTPFPSSSVVAKKEPDKFGRVRRSNARTVILERRQTPTMLVKAEPLSYFTVRGERFMPTLARSKCVAIASSPFIQYTFSHSPSGSQGRPPRFTNLHHLRY